MEASKAGVSPSVTVLTNVGRLLRSLYAQVGRGESPPLVPGRCEWWETDIASNIPAYLCVDDA